LKSLRQVVVYSRETFNGSYLTTADLENSLMVWKLP